MKKSEIGTCSVQRAKDGEGRLIMAETKKTAIVKPAAKAAAAKATDTKTAKATTTPAASVAETESAAEPKKAAAARKTTTRKTAVKKTAAKKETAKKTTAAAKKKAAVKETVYVQFADKSYTSEDLVKIAKDVWKYDLKKKVGDFKSVELYVKPEESVVYYVINGEVKGSFAI